MSGIESEGVFEPSDRQQKQDEAARQILDDSRAGFPVSFAIGMEDFDENED